MASATGTPSELMALFQKLEASFPSDLIPSTRWYLLALPCLLHASETAYAAKLYLYLISKPEYQTPDQRKALVRRIRECLLKTVAILGIPKTLDAIIHIGEVERDEDKDLSFSRENWASGPENTKNAAEWLNRIYSGNLSGPMTAMAAHKDFQYVAREIVYGFFLSPQTTLDAIDTEITVLSGIMIQNMPRETAWHLRGSRRVGMSQAQLSQIQDCIHEIAAFGGLKLDRVPKAADIEHEVPTTELSEM